MNSVNVTSSIFGPLSAWREKSQARCQKQNHPDVISKKINKSFQDRRKEVFFFFNFCFRRKLIFLERYILLKVNLLRHDYTFFLIDIFHFWFLCRMFHYNLENLVIKHFSLAKSIKVYRKNVANFMLA